MLVFDDGVSHLLDLIWLGIGAITLQLDQFSYLWLAEYVMTSTHPDTKAQMGQDATQLIETNIESDVPRSMRSRIFSS